jgi:hypothetical protein
MFIGEYKQVVVLYAFNQLAQCAGGACGAYDVLLFHMFFVCWLCLPTQALCRVLEAQI